MTPQQVAVLVARWIVVAALAYAAVVALTAWAIRSKRLSPFSGWARFVRRIGEPVVLPLERRVLRAGGSPQDAPLWLLGVVIVGGLILITLVNWLIGFTYQLGFIAAAGPRAWLVVAISWTFRILTIALLIRVIASWFGISPYRRWMRPVVALTEWLLEPLRRILPPFGPLDLSPLVAYLILVIAERLILGTLP
ncbi:MAG TPA: YggT family protein [Gemmatimonadales bacterium]|jgi:YggT family protein|nr:YggT family protein [Gemmatimonadales bacterium]